MSDLRGLDFSGGECAAGRPQTLSHFGELQKRAAHGLGRAQQTHMSFAISCEVEGELVFPDFKSRHSGELGISCGLKPHWLVFFQSGPERGIYD